MRSRRPRSTSCCAVGRVRQAAAREEQPEKLVYPLEHAYTPAELSFAALKGADAATAGVLAAAARDAACDLHAALLCIEESGSAEYTGYSRSPYQRRYRDDDVDDDDDTEFEVGEIFERSLTLSHWRGPDDGAAALGVVPFLDAEVCPADALESMAADEQHFHEATGNEGASFERSYQRAALVLWPRVRRLEILARAGFAASLPSLGGLVAQWLEEGAAAGDATWREAHALVAHMLACWPAHAMAGAPDGHSAVAQVLGHLVRLQDREQIAAVLAGVTATGTYGAQDNAGIVLALKLLAAPLAGQLVQAAVLANADLHTGGCADLLVRACAISAWRGELRGAAKALLDALPGNPARPPAQADAWRREAPNAALVHDALRALVQLDADLADQAVSHRLAWPKTYGLDTVIVPALRRLVERPVVLNQPAGQRLRAAALHHLKARVSLDLAPPADWQRQAEFSCRCEHCQKLGRFLQSTVWRFKAREADRRHVEDSIRQG